MFTSTIRMGTRSDQSDFDRGMIVGARQGSWSTSETADLLRFSSTTVSKDCREWCGGKNIYIYIYIL